MSVLRGLAIWAVVSTAGCGLSLDQGAPPEDASTRGMLDVDTRRPDGDVDVGLDVGAVRDDASALVDVGTMTTLDADGPPDADVIDASSGDASDAFVLDASLVDAGSDAGVASDASVPDATMVTCMAVHPIVGPPRTCDPGSCLCVGTDACFTVATVARCCTGAFTCAPPPSDCMGTHPLVGATRTCPSGGCYCASPDACFPADRADRCCAVDVVCVP